MNAPGPAPTATAAPTDAPAPAHAPAPARALGGSDHWWRSAVIYQVYARSFADSDGDGLGDLRGLTARLDHLAYLGVDAVWLCPVYPSPGVDNGYDISDYRGIDPAIGTLEDFDALVARAHELGLRVVLDVVLNHTSDQHPWFVAARSSVDDPHRDWYWWRPPRAVRAGAPQGADRPEPTNWGSFFSGPTWTLDPTSGEYYLHLFAPGQPDLNWENPQVRAALHDMLRWWLDRGVDGLRLDVINLVSKDPALPDGERGPGQVYGNGFPHYANGPRLHEYLAELHHEVLAGREPRPMTVGEMPGVTTELARLVTDPARAELDMVFQFDHVSVDDGPGGKFDPVPVDLPTLKASLARWQDALADTGWNSLYLSNHDQARLVSRFGDDGQWWRESASALATVLHLHRGTPFVFQGEELGMTNAPWPQVTDLRDLEALNHLAEATAAGQDPERVLAGIRARGRDNARTPMQWDAGPQGGFTTGTPWIGVNPNHAWLNAAAQRGLAGSVLEHYRALIALRHTHPVVVDGRFALLAPEHPRLWAFTRTLAGHPTLWVLVNCGGEPLTLPDELVVRGRLVLGNWSEPGADEVLRPWEARVVAV
jgi:oligo-1,6-glucosidase